MHETRRDAAFGFTARARRRKGHAFVRARAFTALVAIGLGTGVWAGLIVPSGAEAADLPGRGGTASSCLIAGRSPLLDLPTGDIAREVEFRFGRAVATSQERAAIASSRPVFAWALETRMACGTAIGYLKSAVIDDVSISKCDCFHDRMIGYFR